MSDKKSAKFFLLCNLDHRPNMCIINFVSALWGVEKRFSGKAGSAKKEDRFYAIF